MAVNTTFPQPIVLCASLPSGATEMRLFVTDIPPLGLIHINCLRQQVRYFCFSHFYGAT